jgi:hypothetical protein
VSGGEVVVRDLRTPADLSDEELSQELYNCAAFLTSACEEDAESNAGEINLELVALLLQRATALVEEFGGEKLSAIVGKADDEDREMLAGTAAVDPPTPEEE